jgi:branched-chain amino acid transport system permease protein
VAYSVKGDSAYWTGLLTLAGIYAIAAIGLNLLFGGAGQISLGHAGFLGLGAWVTAALMVDRALPWVVSAAASIAVAVLVGLLLGYAALRIAGHYLALATVAFGLLFAEVMSLQLPSGLYGIPPVDLFGWQATSQRALLLVVWAIVGVVYLFVRSMRSSRFGRSLAALRDDPLAAAAAGVDVARAKITTFAISAGLGALSGALFAPYQASVTDVSFSFTLSVILLHMIVVGGLGSPGGAVIGALFIVIVPELGRDYERYRLLAFGIVLVLAVVLFPRGIAGFARSTADRWWPASTGRPDPMPAIVEGAGSPTEHAGGGRA